MRLLRHPAPLAAALASLLAAGCGGGSSSPTKPTGTVADLQAAVAAAYVPGSVLPTTVDSTASLVTTIDVDGLRGAAAIFIANGQLENAGTVSERVSVGPGTAESALDEIGVNVQGLTEYLYTSLVSHPLGIALAFDGATWHRVTVAGSAAIPAFTDSVLSVPPPVLGALPDTVGHGAALAVTWTDAGADSTVYVQCALVSRGDSTRVALGVLVRDAAGATTIPGAAISRLPAGPARLSVARYRLAYHAHGAARVGLGCEAVTTHDLVTSPAPALARLAARRGPRG